MGVNQRTSGAALSQRFPDSVAEAAFRALGCIATPTSQRCLLELSQKLNDDSRRKMASTQLSQQFRQ